MGSRFDVLQNWFRSVFRISNGQLTKWTQANFKCVKNLKSLCTVTMLVRSVVREEEELEDEILRREKYEITGRRKTEETPQQIMSSTFT